MENIVISFMSSRFWNLNDLGICYSSVLILLCSILMIKKYILSEKLINALKFFKSLLFLICCGISLKYTDINLKVGINWFYLYNVLQLLNVLEDLNYNEKQKRIKDLKEKEEKGEEKEKKEEYEEEEEDYVADDEATFEAMHKTEKQVEEITESILKNAEKNKLENEAVLKEKQILDEIKKKEAEEEAFMKEKQLSDEQYKRKYYQKKKSWVYTFLSNTFYSFFYLMFWNLYKNIFIVKIYLTLQLMRHLTIIASYIFNYANVSIVSMNSLSTNTSCIAKMKKNNKNEKKNEKEIITNVNTHIQLIQKMLHYLHIFYLTVMCIILTKITYTPGISKSIYTFATISNILFVSYTFVAANSLLSKYYKQFRPSLFCFLLFFHIFAIVGLCRLYYHPYGKSLFIQCIVSYVVSGLGITMGAHRLWSHRSFEAHMIVQVVVFFLNCFANQGSVITWSRNHRLHHKYSDTKYDPHNINRGFFYSHVGWLLYKKPKSVKEKEKEIYLQDLEKNPLLYAQHRYDPYFNLFISFVLPGVYTYFMYGNYWDGFFILAALRWVITLHATWSINSFSHSFGYKPYNIDIKPTNNIFTSLVALGEGSHNYHHVFPSCYAMNENFYIININPTKYIIDVLYHLGLVWNLKSAQNICKEVRIREEKKLEERTRLLTKNVKDQVMKKEEDTNYINDLINYFQTFCNDYINISTCMYILYLLRDVSIILAIFAFHLIYCFYAYGSNSEIGIGNINTNISTSTSTGTSGIGTGIANRIGSIKSMEAIGDDGINGIWNFLVDTLGSWNLETFFSRENKICSIFQFLIFHVILYAIPMGTMFTSLYSLIYECRRGLMFKRPFLNNFVGCIISSSILLPYAPDESKKSLLSSLNEDFLKLFKGPLFLNRYVVVLSLFFTFYGLMMYTFGVFYFSIFFVLPYIVFNIWILMYVRLLQNPPIVYMGTISNNKDKDIDINVLYYIIVQMLLQWKMQNSIYQSKKKLTKMFFSFINFIHHHLCYTHIVEYIHSKIPSYNTKEIYKQFDKKLDQYFCMKNDKFVEILKEFL